MPSSERVPYFDTIVRAVLAVYITVLPSSRFVVERNGFILLLGLLVGWCVAIGAFSFSDTVRHAPVSLCRLGRTHDPISVPVL
jgi:hypothetical protein